MRKLSFVGYIFCAFILCTVAVSCSNFFGDMMIKRANSTLSTESGGLRLIVGDKDLLADDFGANKTEYEVSVGSSVTSVQLAAKTGDERARKVYEAYRILNEEETAVYELVSINSNGQISALPYGKTRIRLTVYAEDDDFKTVYTVYITKVQFTAPPAGFRFKIDATYAKTNTADPTEAVPGYVWKPETPVFPTMAFEGDVLSFGLNTIIESGAEQVAKIEYTAKKKDGTSVSLSRNEYGAPIANGSNNKAVISASASGAKLPDGWTTVTVRIRLIGGGFIGPYTYYVSKPDVSDPTLTALTVKSVTGSETLRPFVTVENLLQFNYAKTAYEFRLPTEAGSLTLNAITSFTGRPGVFPDGAVVTATAVNYRSENNNYQTPDPVGIKADPYSTTNTNTSTDLIIDSNGLPAGKTIITIQAKSADSTNTKKYTVTVIKPEAHEVALKVLTGGGINQSPPDGNVTWTIPNKVYKVNRSTTETKIEFSTHSYYKPAKITYTATNTKIIDNDGVLESPSEVQVDTGIIPLGDGLTTITATVSATDKKETYSKEYTIEVRKPDRNDSSLTKIEMSGGFENLQSMPLVTDINNVSGYYAIDQSKDSVKVAVTTKYRNATISAKVVQETGYNGAGTVSTIDNNESSAIEGENPAKEFTVSGLVSGFTMLAVTVTPEVSSETGNKPTYYVKIFKVDAGSTVILRSLSFNSTPLGIQTNDPSNSENREEVFVADVTSDTEATVNFIRLNSNSTVTAKVYYGATEDKNAHRAKTMIGVTLNTVDSTETLLGNSVDVTKLDEGFPSSHDKSKLIIVKLTIEAGTATKNYYIKIYRTLSSDATLNNLTVNYTQETSSLVLSPVFDSNKTAYTVDTNINRVDYKNIEITATKNHSAQKVNYTVTAEYIEGFTEIITESVTSGILTITNYSQVKTITVTVTVTAEDGTKKTYTVQIFNKINLPSTLKQVTVSDKLYWANTEPNQIAFRFGAPKAAGFGAGEHKGLDITGKKSGSTQWMTTAYGNGGWQYNVNDEWVSITENSTNDNTGFVPVPNNEGLEFAVGAHIVYSGGVPYVIIEHKIKNDGSPKTVKFGAYSDTLISTKPIGTGDSTPFVKTDNGATLTGSDYTFEIICYKGAGIDPVDFLWLGEFHPSNDPAFDMYKDALVSTADMDSAAAYSWQDVDVGAGETVIKTIRIALY